MKIILLLLSFYFSLNSNGQVRIVNESLTDSTVNYFYIGVDNKVTISGIPPEQRTVFLSCSGSVTFVSGDHYIIRVNSVTDYCHLNVAKKGKIIATKDYKVRTLGLIQSNWISGSIIKQDSLLKVPFISYSIPGCYFKLNYEVMSFVATIDSDDSILTFPSTGNHFSDAFIKHLETTEKAGTMLTFDEIRAKGPDGKSFRIPSIVLYLK